VITTITTHEYFINSELDTIEENGIPDVSRLMTFNGGTKHTFTTDVGPELIIYLPKNIGIGLIKNAQASSVKDHTFFIVQKDEYMPNKF